jgi:hypothetical protein
VKKFYVCASVGIQIKESDDMHGATIRLSTGTVDDLYPSARCEIISKHMDFGFGHVTDIRR